jgi:ribonuclease HI
MPQNFLCLPTKNTSSTKIRVTGPPKINKDLPWDFFDGVAQHTPTIGGARGILHISENHHIAFSAGLGEATNNYSELMALYLILLLALENNIRHLNIFGDSMFAIQVMKGTHFLRSYSLVPLLEEIKRCSTEFSHISFSHIYRTHNKKANQLSKSGLELDKGSWKIREEGPDGPQEYFHNTWTTI